jgi:hypothetical protein
MGILIHVNTLSPSVTILAFVKELSTVLLGPQYLYRQYKSAPEVLKHFHINHTTKFYLHKLQPN